MSQPEAGGPGGFAESGTRPEPRKLSLALLCTCLTAALSLGTYFMFAHNIHAVSPYPWHPDEGYITESAWHMLSTGDPNPQFFNYGSFPIYLTAASQQLATWIAIARGELADASAVTSVSFPYYSHPSISLAPRLLFALFSSLALCAVALIGYRLRPRLETALLAPLVLSLMPLFQTQAWVYINVDILATALCCGALAYLLDNEAHFARTGAKVRTRVLWPALLCGATMATKYNAALLGLPFLLALAFSEDKKRFAHIALFGLASLGVFLVLDPYSLLDWQNFVDTLKAEMEHYRTGHAGNDGEPGLAQLIFYLRGLRREIGWVAFVLMGIGVVYGLFAERRKSLLLLAFPVSSLLYMSQQRVHFTRNVLPAFALLCPFIGLGVVALEELVRKGVQRVQVRFGAGRASRRLASGLLPVAVCGVLMALAFRKPRMRPEGIYELATADSRTELASWLAANVPKGCKLILPEELGVAPSTIEPHCQLLTFNIGAAQGAASVATLVQPLRAEPNVFIALPRWGVHSHSTTDPDAADAWNELPATLELERPVFRAGTGRVNINRKRVNGNPRVLLYPVSAAR